MMIIIVKIIGDGVSDARKNTQYVGNGYEGSNDHLGPLQRAIGIFFSETLVSSELTLFVDLLTLRRQFPLPVGTSPGGWLPERGGGTL